MTNSRKRKASTSETKEEARIHKNPSLVLLFVEDIRVERIEATPLVDPPCVDFTVSYNPAAKPNEMTSLQPIQGDFKLQCLPRTYSLAS